MKHCDACGCDVKGGVGVGGTILCRPCAADVRAEIDQLRAGGKPVNAMHIARRMFRENHSAGDYLLRDIPTDLWDTARAVARERGQSLRDMLLDGLRSIL